MKTNKKMMALLIAASMAASTLTGCSNEKIDKVVIGIEEEFNKNNDDNKPINTEKVEKTTPTPSVTETTEVVETPVVEENPEDKYRYNAILEEYEDGTKLVRINGEDIIITDDVVVRYDEEGIAYLEQAPLEWAYEKRGIESYEAVRANCTVNLRNAPGVEGEKIGTLAKGQTFEVTNYYMDNGWYEINYYGTPAYVCGEYVDELIGYRFNTAFENTYYSTEDKVLIVPGYLRETCDDEEITIPAGELFEVYKNIDDPDYYFVQTSDYIGYITKDHLEELSGTFMVVDISDQNVKMYKDGEIVLDTRVVTGKPSTPTTLGIYEIFSKSTYRYLVGPTWKSWVDYMDKFNGGIGFHDAEYHKCSEGGSHGWRSESEFGGATYLTAGSHGCVNMRHEDAEFVHNNVENGTKVLVKK